MNKDYVRLTIGMPSETKKQLRIAAASLDIPMSDLLLKLIEEYLKDKSFLAS